MANYLRLTKNEFSRVLRHLKPCLDRRLLPLVHFIPSAESCAVSLRVSNRRTITQLTFDLPFVDSFSNLHPVTVPFSALEGLLKVMASDSSSVELDFSDLGQLSFVVFSERQTPSMIGSIHNVGGFPDVDKLLNVDIGKAQTLNYSFQTKTQWKRWHEVLEEERVALNGSWETSLARFLREPSYLSHLGEPTSDDSDDEESWILKPVHNDKKYSVGFCSNDLQACTGSTSQPIRILADPNIVRRSFHDFIVRTTSDLTKDVRIEGKTQQVPLYSVTALIVRHKGNVT